MIKFDKFQMIHTTHFDFGILLVMYDACHIAHISAV